MINDSVKFTGTREDFLRFIQAMKSEGLDVQIEAAIPLEVEHSEFEFKVIKVLTIIRLAEELAKRTQMSVTEVESAFISAACAESMTLDDVTKLQLINRFYGGFTR